MPPVRMTRAEYETKYGVAPVVSSSTLDITPTPVRMTQAEYDAKYRPKPQTALQDFKTDVIETKDAVKNTFVEGANKFSEIDERVASGETSKVKGLFQKFGKALGTATNALFQTGVGIAKADVPQSVEDKTKEFFRGMGNELTAYNKDFYENQVLPDLESEDPDKKASARLVVDTVDAYKNDANFRADVDAAGSILEWLTLPASARTVAVKTADLAGDVAGAVEDAGIAVRKISDGFTTSRNDARVAAVADEIAAVEEKYAPTRRKADLDPLVNESRTRIAQSNVLNNAVDEDGLIRTKTKGGAIDAYKNAPISKNGLSMLDVEDVVKKNLETEGKKVNLGEVRADMYDAVTKSGLEGADLAKAIKGIGAELQGLALRADEFGDVLLSKIQDAKTSIYKHIDYTKPAGVTYRKSLARVYKETIENKSDLPVKEWNGELAKYYKDLDRLADLDGKRVKGGRLGKYTAQLAGTALGGLGGSVGGAGGAIAGGIAGGELSSFLAGKSMARTFRQGVKADVPENKILAEAKARAEAGGTKDLTKSDPQVGAPKSLMSDPDLPAPVRKEINKVEAQIKSNVKQQNAAIKAGDFALVDALKDVYKVLVERLKEIIADYRKNGIQPGLSIKKSVTPESVAKKADAEDMKLLASVIDDVKTARLDPDTNRILSNMGLGRATDEELVAFAKEVFDEKDGVASRVVQPQNDLMSDQNQAISAPTNAQTIPDTVQDGVDSVNAPQTTALLEEAKYGTATLVDKYPDLAEAMFRLPDNITVYRGSGKGIGNSTLVKGEYWADSKEFAKTFGEVTEETLPKNTAVLDLDIIKNNPDQTLVPKKLLVDQQALTDYLIDKGVEYTKNTNTRGIEFVKLNKLESQLRRKAATMSQSDFKKFVMDNYDQYRSELARISKNYTQADMSQRRSSIEDIWKQANETKPTLLEEARKYKSADEFVDAVRKQSDNAGGRGLRESKLPELYKKVVVTPENAPTGDIDFLDVKNVTAPRIQGDLKLFEPHPNFKSSIKAASFDKGKTNFIFMKQGADPAKLQVRQKYEFAPSKWNTKDYYLTNDGGKSWFQLEPVDDVNWLEAGRLTDNELKNIWEQV